jgi:aspirochlorine biosynthesis cytochrome P450 monooxygenase
MKIPLGPFRGYSVWLLSFYHRRKLEHSVRMVLPVVHKRLEEEAKGVKISRFDAIEWTLAFSGPTPQEKEPRRIALELLQNLWAGSSAPGGLVTEMLYELLMGPHHLEPLRAEAEKAIATYGWTDKAITKLYLLDSFIREINRLYPTGSGEHACP